MTPSLRARRPAAGVLAALLTSLPIHAQEAPAAEAPDQEAPQEAPAQETPSRTSGQDGSAQARAPRQVSPRREPPLPDAVQEDLTLDAAVAIVLSRNLQLAIEDVTTEIARFDALGSWGAFDPIFSTSVSYTESERESSNAFDGGFGSVIDSETRTLQQGLNVPLTTGGNVDLSFNANNNESTSQNAVLGTSTAADITLSYTQPLLRGAWSDYATTDQRLAELGFRQALERRRQVRQDLILQVHEAYWNLVEANETVNVRMISLDLGKEQLEQDRRRLEVGVGTEVDVLQAETNVATNEEQLLLAEVNAEAALDTLKSLLFNGEGPPDLDRYERTWNQRISPATSLPDVATEQRNWTRSLAHALRRRTELEQQRLEVERQTTSLERAKSDQLPGLDLNLSASNRGFDGTALDAVNEALGTDFPTYSASLSFDVPLFNRRASNARRAARARLRSSRLDYDRIEQDVVSDVRAKVRDVNYRAAAVGAAQKSLELAQRQLQAEQARYDEGLSTTFQVLQFQETLAEALVTERAARAAYARAIAQLQRSEGWLGDDARP